MSGFNTLVMALLSTLPTDIQEHIVRYAVDSDPETAAIYACVSRFWQTVVEMRTFRSLRSDSSHLDDFRRIVTPSRQAHVRRIDYAIELPVSKGYPWGTEFKVKTPEEQHGYNRAFTDAIIGLFGALASWVLQDDRNDEAPRVELFLSIYSPSDFCLMPKTLKRQYLRVPRRWNTSVLDLVGGAAETLPCLPMIAAFEYRPRHGRPMVRNHLAPGACCRIAAKLPSVQKLVLYLEDRDTGDSSARRRQIRQDFAACLAEIPGSVRHFELRFENFGPANHAAVQPTAFVAQGTAPDALSEAL